MGLLTQRGHLLYYLFVDKHRVFLFRWDQAAAEQTAADLRAQGWQVEVEWQDGERGSKAASANPPDAFVFFLDYKPSHSRVTAEYLARAKTTRGIPMMFVGGQGGQLETAKQKIPTGQFISEASLEKTLEALAK